jgi:hypothetical protein
VRGIKKAISKKRKEDAILERKIKRATEARAKEGDAGRKSEGLGRERDEEAYEGKKCDVTLPGQVRPVSTNKTSKADQIQGRLWTWTQQRGSRFVPC